MESYSQLKTDIKDEIARQDLTDAELDNFLVRAISRINRLLRIGGMETEADVTVDAKTVSLPSDFRGARAFYISSNSGGNLRYIPPEVMPEFDNGSTGIPTVFTIRNATLVFDKTPDTTYTGKLTYYQKFSNLSDANTTNWLTDNAPDCLFYGALYNACIYTGDSDMASSYKVLFEECIEELKESYETDSYGPAPVMRTEGCYP